MHGLLCADLSGLPLCSLRASAAGDQSHRAEIGSMGAGGMVQHTKGSQADLKLMEGVPS